MSDRRRKYFLKERKKYPVSPFRDVLFCADCGKRMYIMHKNGKHINSDSYVCSTYRKSAKQCSSHYIKEDELIRLVSDDIRKYIRYLVMDETTFRNNLLRLVKSRTSAEVSEASERIREIECRLNEIPDLRKKLFEEKLSGSIARETFADIMTSLDEESETLRKEHEELTILLNSTKDSLKSVEIFISRLKRQQNFEALNTDVTDELIERIEVCEQDRADRKHLKTPEICIFYIGVGDIEGVLS